MVGMANSRNTCVDMRLACVACRPLGETRLLCCLPSLPSFPPALQESHWLLSTRTLSCFVHTSRPETSDLPQPLLQLSHTMHRTFLRACGSWAFTDFRTHRFPLLAHSLWREIVTSWIRSILLLENALTLQKNICLRVVNTLTYLATSWSYPEKTKHSTRICERRFYIQ